MILVSAKNGHDWLKLVALLNVTDIGVNKVVMRVKKFFSDDDDSFLLWPPPPLNTGYLVITLSLLPCLYLPFEGYLATKTVHLSPSSSLHVSTFSGLLCNQASPAVSVCFLPRFYFVGPSLCLSPLCTGCIATRPFKLSAFPRISPQCFPVFFPSGQLRYLSLPLRYFLSFSCSDPSPSFCFTYS